MIFLAFRHLVAGERAGRWRRLRGWLGSLGRERLLSLSPTLLLQLLQFVHGGGEGSLEAGAAPVDAVQQIELGA